jgi:hypothetical protein
MEIKPGTGFEKLVFGMTQEEVIAGQGDADVINDIDEESEQYIIYYYYDDQVKLYFDKDHNFRLFSIEILDKKMHYLNVEVIDMKEKDLRTLLFRNKLKYDVEEYPSFHIIHVPSQQVFINIELDRVRSVEMQPLVKNKKIVWPKR